MQTLRSFFYFHFLSPTRPLFLLPFSLQCAKHLYRMPHVLLFTNCLLTLYRCLPNLHTKAAPLNYSRSNIKTTLDIVAHRFKDQIYFDQLQLYFEYVMKWYQGFRGCLFVWSADCFERRWSWSVVYITKRFRSFFWELPRMVDAYIIAHVFNLQLPYFH